ncbi:malto-oligosyltrehalose synthase [Pseudomonas sp. EL_65y_Pfl2_R95]|uniref:malto-oligosyltrehalose synthase n=1 Tax=Pseudomonas sp. EL_65y_Pfl2_R95 TaxID=3088698 RepID=UPI0030DC3BB0
MNELSATVRLQCHADFTLDDVSAQLDYFARLGISHVYLSPIFQAVAGSVHGYDGVDPSQVNSDLGGEPALERLVAALRARKMGLILDIVPNHMQVADNANSWWQSVLEWGQLSPYADFFDIDWLSPVPGLRGKVLAPVLDGDLDANLDNQALQLIFCTTRRRFYIEYFDQRFPLCPSSYAQILNPTDAPELNTLASAFGAAVPTAKNAALRKSLADFYRQAGNASILQAQLQRFNPATDDGKQRLKQLLTCQHFYLSDWRSAQDIINWRRFFDINQLGSLRMERGDVFETVHAKVFELIARGWVDGLRIDHIDGLADPSHYCRRLRRRLDGLQSQRPAHLQTTAIAIYVEKIQGAEQQLPVDWPVQGTTGYDFMNDISAVLHDPQAAEPLRTLWQQQTGRTADFIEEVRVARALLLETSLKADFERQVRGLLALTKLHPSDHDQSPSAIRRVLREILLHFPVYRLYPGPCGRSAQDQAIMRKVLTTAGEHLADGDRALLLQIDHWLGATPLREWPANGTRQLARKVVAQFNQLTAPLAAKSVEDTACYRHGVLLSRNDVGFDPEHLALPVEQFHQRCSQRSKQHPFAMLTTATHDNKRGEDLRARLAVVSENPQRYARGAQNWLNQIKQLQGSSVEPHDLLMLYQMLLGGWPLQPQQLDDFLPRLQQWWLKALREAKLRSSWGQPDEAYEAACAALLNDLFTSSKYAALLASIEQAAMTLAPAGAINALTQALLKMTTPGVPDLYQGCDLWDFTFVDPDNRQPVDFNRRSTALNLAVSPSALLESWRDGRVKQWLIAKVLNHRLSGHALYSQGEYLPLNIQGRHANHLIAFARADKEALDIIVAPRLVQGLLGAASTPLIHTSAWQDTWLQLPGSIAANAQLQGLFCNKVFSASNNRLPVQALLADFPVQVLCLRTNQGSACNEPL